MIKMRIQILIFQPVVRNYDAPKCCKYGRTKINPPLDGLNTADAAKKEESNH